MRPYSKDSPTEYSKNAAIEPVTCGVAGDFTFPIHVIILWHTAMPRATMPEAPINEDGHAFAAENEVGAAGNGLVAPPAGDPMSPQDGHQFQFGLFISLRPNGSHDFGSLLLCEYVRHYLFWPQSNKARR